MNQRSLGKAARGRRRLIEALEPRRLMDATSVAAGHVALIDASLPDYKSLAAAVAEHDNVILYDGRRDTAKAVLDKLVRWAAATRQQIHSISIVSHGAAGGFQLGKDWITSESVQKKSWQKLKNVLAEDASIHLFGCNVAADAKGQTLLDHLAALSGADVYGSTDLTGSARRGGDWVLEASSRGAAIASAAEQAAAPLRQAALAAWDFSLAAGIIVSPVAGLRTGESGGRVTFDIVLAEQPTADVAIGLTTSDSTEGTVAQSQVTFTPANWNVPQTVAVDGVDDLLDDGDVAYQIVTARASSSDTGYNNLNAPDVAVTNVDDDPRGLTSGGEFRVNTTTSGAQLLVPENNRSVAMDAAGNFVVTWSSFGQDGSGYGVYAQRYTAAGVAVGGEFRVNTVTAGDQQYPSIAMDAAGNFVVVWAGSGQDGSGYGVYARRYSAAGAPLDAAGFRVNITTAGDQYHPVAATDAAGNFVVAWVSGSAQDGQGTGIYARRFSAAGAALSGEFRVNTTTANNQSEPTIAMADGGAFVIAWADSSSGSTDVRAQRFSAAGAAQGGEILVNTETFKDQRNPGAAMDAAGNFVIVWSSAHQDSTGNRFGIFAQRFSAAGARLGGETQVNPPSSDNQRYATIAMDDSGDYVIAWSDAGADGSGWGIFAQQYHADGSTRGGAIAVNTFTSGDQVYAAVAMDAGGDAVIAWSSDGQDGSGQGIYAQRYQGGNDAPVHALPGAQSVNEDATLVFSAANGNLISVSDSDIAGDTLRVALTATNGLLTLGGVAGLTFTAGDGAGDATMTFTGTLASINAALAGMSFAPAAGYGGAASLHIATYDFGNSGWDGPQSDSDTLNITVNAVNDPPVNTVPGAQLIDEDAPLVLSGANGNAITIADNDGGTVRVTLTATNGRLTLARLIGLSFTAGDGADDATMTFTGTPADVNAALDGLRFDPSANYNGAANIAVTTNDLGNTGLGGAQTDTDNVAIAVNPVNDAPLNTLPPAQNVNEDVALVFSSASGNLISIADVDGGGGGGAVLRVTLAATNGLLTLSGTSGLSFTTGDGAGDALLVFSGAAADINAALNGMTFTPTANYNGAASLEITADDQGNTGAGGAQADSDTLAITVNAVNDAPVNSLPPAQAVDEDATLIFSATGGNAITIDDLDAAGGLLRITLGVTNGLLTLAQLAGLSFTAGNGAADATMTFTGSLADINAALDGLRFTPAANFNGAANLTVTANDLGNTGAGGPQSDTGNVAITVNSVNDAPFNLVPAAQSIGEDHALVFSFGNGNRVLIDDIDAGSLSVRVTLTATNGTLTLAGTTGLGFTVGDGVDDATMTFTGSVIEINHAMEGLVFRPSPNFAGAAAVTITTNDRGNSGAGGALGATSTINVAVSVGNDPPAVVTTPGSVTYRENDPAMVLDAGVTVSDVDTATLAGATVAIINFVAGEDVLAFIAQNGISGSFNTTTGVLTLSGVASAADYQAALRSVTYVNTSEAPRSVLRTVAFTVYDGSAASNAATRPLVVTPVNDPPTAAPLVVTLSEDAGRSSIDLWRMFNDIDDAHETLSVSVVGSTNPTLFSAVTIDAAAGRLYLDSAADAFGDAVVTLRAADAAGQEVETTLTLNVASVNDAPAVGTTPAPTLFDPAQPTYVDADLLISDADSAVLLGATVRIVDYVAGVDALAFTDQTGITGTFDTTSGILTLTGSASVAQYEQALRSVRYTNAAGARAGGILSVEFSVMDDAGAASTMASRPIAFASEPQVMPPPPPPAPEPEPEPELEPEPTPEPEPEENEETAPPVVRPPIPPRTAETTPPTPEAPLPPPPVPPPVVEADPQPAFRPADPEVVAPVVMPPPPVIAPQPPPPPPVVVAQPPSEKLWQQLDVLAKELEPTNAMPKLNVGTVSGVSTTLLSVGYVIWCLRGGAFIGTLLTTLPLWRWLDPLPVLDARERTRKKDGQSDEDEERIRSMMD